MWNSLKPALNGGCPYITDSWTVGPSGHCGALYHEAETPRATRIGKAVSKSAVSTDWHFLRFLGPVMEMVVLLNFYTLKKESIKAVSFAAHRASSSAEIYTFRNTLYNHWHAFDAVE